MKKLMMTVGLPRSGKTTWAQAGRAPIVCPDQIRYALHGQRFIPEAEMFVWAIAHCMVKALFLAGHDTVILDATNGTKARREEWRSKSWVREFVFIGTPKEECIRRAIALDDNYIVPIIEKMAASWENVEAEEEELL